MHNNTNTRVPWRGLTNTVGAQGTVVTDFLSAAQLPVDQRLPAIDFTSQDYESYKKSLVNYLKTFYPLDYNNFAESDLGMMIVNLLAYLGANLSLKADMLANESFLETARTQGNVSKLLKLIGIDLRGPLAAKADASLTLNDAFPFGDTSYKINKEDRTIKVTSSRDGRQIGWTLYSYNQTNKELNLIGDSDLVIPITDFISSTTTNLVFLEGILVEESGTFRSDQVSKTITLAQAPVIEGSIEVSSQSDGFFAEIDSLYLASGATHQVFEKTYDNNFGVVISFGDSVRGKSPVDGDSYKVIYRVGGGFRGNIKNNFIAASVQGATQGSNTSNTSQVSNISIGTGGADAETIEHAKTYAPYVFRAQYRAVTADDYTSLANAFESSVGKAKCIAVQRQSGAGANIVDIYCLLFATKNQLERASLIYKQELIDYFQKVKTISTEVVAVDGLVRTLDLILTIVLRKSQEVNEESIKAKVASDITSFFHADKIDFGMTVPLGDIISTAMNVTEVTYATVDNIGNDLFTNYNEILQLNNLEINVEYV